LHGPVPQGYTPGVANETRKLRRNQSRDQILSGKEKKALLSQPLQTQGGADIVDPFSGTALKSTLLRVGLIVGAVWLVGGLIAAMAQSTWARYIALGTPLLISVGVVGVLLWTLRRARSAREMAGVLSGVRSDEDRKVALEKLDATGKKGDPATVFAKAQLQMQQDPRAALATLETIDLSRVMGQVADEARSQRAMIHLTLGQVSLARQLVDNIELKRHQDPRSRAMMGAIAAETWARSGESKKALETLDLFDLKDEQLAPLRPQLLRSYAFGYAHTGRNKELKQTLKQMLNIDARLLGGFLQGKGHPLLQKEAKRMLEQSGVVPKKMQVQRMR